VAKCSADDITEDIGGSRDSAERNADLNRTRHRDPGTANDTIC
jgi:hypothetical protein